MQRYLLTALAAAALAMPLGAQVTINTGTPTDGVFPLGKDSDFPGIPTAMAQTFQLPGGMNYLQTFSFFISGGIVGGSALQLAASVYQFDTDHLVGAPLFFSGLFNGTDDPGTFDEIDFGASSPLNVPLIPGQTYALVLSSVEGYSVSPAHATITGGAMATDEYTGGSLFITTNTDPTTLSDPGAFFVADSPDAAFKATFTAGIVPEPASTTLVVTGLVGLGLIVQRRRRPDGARYKAA